MQFQVQAHAEFGPRRGMSTPSYGWRWEERTCAFGETFEVTWVKSMLNSSWE